MGWAAATQQFSGQTPGGAFYQIEAPDNWVPADGLLINNHGFQIDQVAPAPDLGVLREVALEQGMAVAASSYRQAGWALFHTLEDNRELYQAFEEHLGRPLFVYLFGGSMGGLVSLQAAEQGGVGNVVGAYAVCAPAHGAYAWDQAFDLRVIYDAVCSDVSGGDIPGATTGLPFTLDPDQYDGILGDVTAGLVASAVVRCTGYELPEWLQSDGQQQRFARILDAAGIGEEWFGLNMAYAVFGLSDLIHASEKLASASSVLFDNSAFDNMDVDYGDPQINADVVRVAANPFQRQMLRAHYTPMVPSGNTKILATHTDKDDLVVVEHQHSLTQQYPADALATAVVVEDQGSHCGYTEAELLAGWDALQAWVQGGEKPDATALQSRCDGIEQSGDQPGPCRYDPKYAVASIDTRIRPRAEAGLPITSAVNGRYGTFGTDWADYLVWTNDLGDAVTMVSDISGHWDGGRAKFSEFGLISQGNRLILRRSAAPDQYWLRAVEESDDEPATVFVTTMQLSDPAKTDEFNPKAVWTDSAESVFLMLGEDSHKRSVLEWFDHSGSIWRGRLPPGASQAHMETRVLAFVDDSCAANFSRPLRESARKVHLTLDCAQQPLRTFRLRSLDTF